MRYSESELISEIKRHNEQAFDDLIREYTKPVYYLTYNILGIGNSREDIEECVSDVFVEVWERIDEFDGRRGNFRKWILMLTKYRALTCKRRLEKHPVEYLDDDTQRALADPSSPILDRETQQVILQIVKTFNDVDRQLFIRRYFLDEPVSLLMESMGMTRSAIDNRLSRSRNKIKEALFCG